MSATESRERRCAKCGGAFTAERPEVLVGDDVCGHWKPRFSAHIECIAIAGNRASSPTPIPPPPC